MRKCRRCGNEFNKDKRYKYCDDCPNERWSMKPCRDCGKPKPDGKGHSYCPECQERHAAGRGKAAAARKRAWRYGLTIDELNELLAKGKCEVCGSKKKLVVDHDHDTEKVRGLLCDLCNKALGHARDDVNILAGLIQYLGRGN